PQAAPSSRHLTLTIDHVWLAATLTFAFIVGTLLQADQTDYWWTVKLGEGLWATGQLPAADPLAFTSTREPYVEQQWLAPPLPPALPHPRRPRPPVGVPRPPPRPPPPPP